MKNRLADLSARLRRTPAPDLPQDRSLADALARRGAARKPLPSNFVYATMLRIAGETELLERRRERRGIIIVTVTSIALLLIGFGILSYTGVIAWLANAVASDIILPMTQMHDGLQDAPGLFNPGWLIPLAAGIILLAAERLLLRHRRAKRTA